MALSIFMMGAMSAFAQNAPINFESGGQGANWTWTSFENDANAQLKIVANPNKSGGNTSNIVAKLTPLKTRYNIYGFSQVKNLHVCCIYIAGRLRRYPLMFRTT